ncbi:MAG: hypothetical protein Q7S40_24505 [Opitutaceae bacterium]|nr:hypothetical protein [Opitutaceae bacterium]
MTGRSPWLFAILYTALSIAIEIVLIVVFRLKVPQHNAIIAPIILTLPPMLAVWIAGYRSRKQFVVLAGLTALLSVIVTLTVTHFTGVSTGLREPLINRPIAGFLAAVMVNRWIVRANVPSRAPEERK